MCVIHPTFVRDRCIDYHKYKYKYKNLCVIYPAFVERRDRCIDYHMACDWMHPPHAHEPATAYLLAICCFQLSTIYPNYITKCTFRTHTRICYRMCTSCYITHTKLLRNTYKLFAANFLKPSTSTCSQFTQIISLDAPWPTRTEQLLPFCSLLGYSYSTDTERMFYIGRKL